MNSLISSMNLKLKYLPSYNLLRIFCYQSPSNLVETQKYYNYLEGVLHALVFMSMIWCYLILQLFGLVKKKTQAKSKVQRSSSPPSTVCGFLLACTYISSRPLQLFSVENIILVLNCEDSCTTLQNLQEVNWLLNLDLRVKRTSNFGNSHILFLKVCIVKPCVL